MRTSQLLEKLFDIERSIGVENDETIRNKIIEVEEDVLFIQRERIEMLRALSEHSNRCNQSLSLVLTSTGL
jgi:hypothetical protein